MGRVFISIGIVTLGGDMEDRWLDWVKSLRSLARAGLTYSNNPYDLHRYSQLLELAATIMSDLSSSSFERILTDFQNQVGYETPKVDVRGVVFKEDSILLVKELADEGRWTLPGGWADCNDSPQKAVEREVFEESGYETIATKLLAVFDRRFHGHTPPHPYGIYKLFFLCELIGGKPTESLETGGAEFFTESEIPELSISRVTPSEIHRMFEHYRNPDLPTDFD
jgi:ADP-ribose pyrophosphatase YjhB (NUDIX family)